MPGMLPPAAWGVQASDVGRSGHQVARALTKDRGGRGVRVTKQRGGNRNEDDGDGDGGRAFEHRGDGERSEGRSDEKEDSYGYVFTDDALQVEGKGVLTAQIHVRQGGTREILLRPRGGFREPRC